jgi:hypothetical protein
MTTDMAYGLTINPALEPFRAEIDHAFGFLDTCYGLRRMGNAARRVHYGADAPEGSLHVPSALFPSGVRIREDGIAPARSSLLSVEQGHGVAPLLPPVGPAGKDAASADGRFGYDAPGMIFHQLSRLEERDHSEGDRHGRFPFDASLASRTGRLDEPLADRAAHDLARAITGLERPRLATRYTIRLTHDVDMLKGYHRPLEPIRYAGGDILKRRLPANGLRRLSQAYGTGLPWSGVENLMALSERHGLQSRFYFMGPSERSQDSPYAARYPKLLRRVAQTIHARGHVVGFHPGFGTSSDETTWLMQRQALEAIVEQPVREGRQHMLMFSIDRTPQIWDAAGMTSDATLAFPEATCFRSGTCRPHHAYCLISRRTLALRMFNTPILDFGYFSAGRYRDLAIEDALAEAEGAVATCRRYAGTLVILKHLDRTKGPIQTFYEALLPLAAAA